MKILSTLSHFSIKNKKLDSTWSGKNQNSPFYRGKFGLVNRASITLIFLLKNVSLCQCSAWRSGKACSQYGKGGLGIKFARTIVLKGTLGNPNHTIQDYGTITKTDTEMTPKHIEDWEILLCRYPTRGHWNRDTWKILGPRGFLIVAKCARMVLTTKGKKKKNL